MRPPVLARLLLGVCLRGEGAEFVRGDIEEEYRTLAVERGRRAADRWYRSQAASTAWAWIGRAKEGTIDGLWRDTRYAVRGLRRSPGYAASAVLTTGIGLAGVVSVLALAQTILGPLPFPESERLVEVRENVDGRSRAVAPANYLDWRRSSSTIGEMAALDTRFASLTVDGNATRGAVAVVSGNFFETLKVVPALGRAFDSTLDTNFPRLEAVLSHATWRDLFGADPAAVGRTFQVEELTYEVVGVAPAGFGYPAPAISAWLRSRTEAPDIPGFQGDLSGMRDAWYFGVVGRLADGVTLAAVRAEMDAISHRLAEAYPDDNRGVTAAVTPLLDLSIAAAREPLTTLGVAVALVLLAALVNVSHLMLARADARSAELAVRAALGAGRGALFRQTVTEGALVGLAGTVVGIATAHVTLALAGSRLGTALPRTDEVALTASTVASAVLLGVGASLVVASAVHLFGHSEHGRPRTVRAWGTAASGLARSSLVAAQIAAAIALLSGSVLLGRSIRALAAVDLGFAEDATVTLRVAIPDAREQPYEVRIQAYERLANVVRALPDVEAVGFGSSSPLAVGARATLFRFGEFGNADPRSAPDAGWQPVSPDFFASLGVPVLRGRGFERGDDSGVADLGIVNETLARQAFGDEDPIGQRVSIGLDGHDRPITIVGVVADTRTRGPGSPPGGVLFRPVAQTTSFGATAVFFTVRSPDAGGELLAEARGAIRAEDPALPVYSEALGSELDRAFQSSQVTLLWILGVFAGVALLLGAVGVYGVAAYSVRRRRREIGVRMALGAGRWHVVRQVLGTGLARASIGVPLGVLTAVLLGRSLGTVLFGVSPAEPLTLGAVSLAVLGVTTLALLVPAGAAAGTDPAEVTRQD